jgi:hypothetical protein
LNDDKPLIAITLCGQVARTELQSKLNYLLDNNNDYNLVLIVVMNDDDNRFTNFNGTQHARSFNGTIHQLVDIIAQSIDWPMIVLHTNNNEIATQTPLIATAMFRSQSWLKDIWQRVYTVSQQFTKYAFATTLIEHIEHQLQFEFDFVVKLRDDDLLLPTFDLHYVLRRMLFNKVDIALVGCVWDDGGVNDHLRVMTRRSLQATSYDLLTMVCCYRCCLLQL